LPLVPIPVTLPEVVMVCSAIGNAVIAILLSVFF
jgi:hypothetical protein